MIQTCNVPNGERTSNGACLPRLTESLRARFFAALAETCNVTESARRIGMSRRHMHHMRVTDKEFAKSWENAIEQATDALEAAARGRAIDGYKRPIYQGGKKVGEEIVYSDRMTEILLKAHRPEKFREKGFDLPPGSEIVIAMRTASDDKSDKAIDVTPGVEKPVKITD